MRALENKYYSHHKVYFLNVSQKVLLFEKSKRYIYKSIHLNAESNFFILKRLESRRRILFTKTLISVFLLYLNNYKTFFLSDKKQFCLIKKQLYKKHSLAKIIRKKKSLLIGCVLKKVKGGFIVDFRGFLCFLPYSLSKSSLENHSYNFPLRFFSILSLTLQYSKNKGLYLSTILSSKSTNRENFFLKKAITYNLGLFFKSF
jgi:ribosomal protein S1